MNCVERRAPVKRSDVVSSRLRHLKQKNCVSIVVTDDIRQFLKALSIQGLPSIAVFTFHGNNVSKSSTAR
jgi:uncharacterized Rossmann fold enzyme